MAHDSAIQPAYVLHSRRYGDSSLIVECLTRDAGRVPLMARGALGSKKHKQALLQPFTPLLLAWRGRGDMPTLSALEAAGQPFRLSGQKLFCGIYLNELIQKLTARQDPHVELFARYSQTLQALAGEDAVEPILRNFELGLLQNLGLGLILDIDINGQPIQSENRYYYDPAQGARPSASHDASTVQGETLLALYLGELVEPQIVREARQLMRRVLSHHLGGQPLKSRELFR